jgi:hypothetical protein
MRLAQWRLPAAPGITPAAGSRPFFSKDRSPAEWTGAPAGVSDQCTPGQDPALPRSDSTRKDLLQKNS